MTHIYRYADRLRPDHLIGPKHDSVTKSRVDQGPRIGVKLSLRQCPAKRRNVYEISSSGVKQTPCPDSAGESSYRDIQIRIANNGALRLAEEQCDNESLGEMATALLASEMNASDTFESVQFSITSDARADNR